MSNEFELSMCTWGALFPHPLNYLRQANDIRYLGALDVPLVCLRRKWFSVVEEISAFESTEPFFSK